MKQLTITILLVVCYFITGCKQETAEAVVPEQDGDSAWYEYWESQCDQFSEEDTLEISQKKLYNSLSKKVLQFIPLLQHLILGRPHALLAVALDLKDFIIIY